MGRKMNTEFKRSDITLNNWRTRPYSKWAYQNISELIPSAIISGTQEKESNIVDFSKFDTLQVNDENGKTQNLSSFLNASETDAMVIMRDGKIIAEWYAEHCQPQKPHLIFSISKSILGLLAGVIIENGHINLTDELQDVLPNCKGSAYDGATFQQLLNMKISLVFDEAYLDRDGVFDQYRRSMLWNPETSTPPAPGLKELLCSIPKAKYEHGKLHDYKSPNADFAGIILEEATGQRIAELFHKYIWLPMGAKADAHITLDRAGNARTSGGFSMTARDLARIGEIVRLSGNGVIPPNWVDAIWQGGNQQDWKESFQGPLLANGSYKNYWYHINESMIAGIGLMGQWLWVDKKSGTTIVKLSSERAPTQFRLDLANIEMMKKICAH